MQTCKQDLAGSRVAAGDQLVVVGPNPVPSSGRGNWYPQPQIPFADPGVADAPRYPADTLTCTRMPWKLLRQMLGALPKSIRPSKGLPGEMGRSKL